MNVPVSFKSAYVRPLLKKPNLDPNTLKNYRPQNFRKSGKHPHWSPLSFKQPPWGTSTKWQN